MTKPPVYIPPEPPVGPQSSAKARSTRRMVMTAVICIAAIGAVILYASVDPSTNLYPRCSFRMLTGLSCPGCGSQRALHALLNGDPAAAIRFNAILAIEIPLIVLLIVSRLAGDRAPRLRKFLSARIFILLLLSTIIIWTVVRNILEI